MKYSKVKQIQPSTLIVGIDIAIQTHWAQMILQGKLIGKPFSNTEYQRRFRKSSHYPQSLATKIRSH